MRISFICATLSLAMIGCQASTTTEQPKPNSDKADIKVRAPGVKVDIERGDGKKDVKVDVDPNR